jgi:glycosyltransferase involved in cell wall biosynthesis
LTHGAEVAKDFPRVKGPRRQVIMMQSRFNPKRWVAVLGRQDLPTDGIEDYCFLLARALRDKGILLQSMRVPWAQKGWTVALRNLWRDSVAWRGRWVVIQYTALSWSRHGLPFGVLVAIAIIRLHRGRCAVVFHESSPTDGRRIVDRLRVAFQMWVMRRLHGLAERAIFTVPLRNVSWLTSGDNKAVSILIGSNVPQNTTRRSPPLTTDQEKTVIVFGVTGLPETQREVEEITAVIGTASKTLSKLRLVVVGRGSTEARESLAKALNNTDVALEVLGVLPADEVAREFKRADAMLFVRGPVLPQRGSAIAGIACGLPIVGYRKGHISEPFEEAGIEWSMWGDRQGLVLGLIRVLSDPARWTELHKRNLETQELHFSWCRIADRFAEYLGGVS